MPLNQTWVIALGDTNYMDLDMLLHTDSALKQIVTIPTRKGKTLVVFVTNLGASYQVPIALPPLQPDYPEHVHPSDHNGLLVLPVHIDNMTRQTKKSLCDVFLILR